MTTSSSPARASARTRIGIWRSSRGRSRAVCITGTASVTRANFGPGMLQQMTAGRGIVHSEVNPSRTEVARWVQMWVVPDRRGLTPSYQDLDLDASGALAEGDLVPLVGRRHPHALAEHHQQDAVFWAGRLPAGRKVLLPRAPMLHCYVTTGAAEVEGVGILREGDAARLTTGGGEQLIAAADGSAEVLVWEMHATVADQWPSTGGH